MISHSIFRAGAALLVAVSLLPAQKKQPQLKSKSEQEGYMAIVNATEPNARIKAIDDFLAKFADTELKPIVLIIAAESARQANDFERMVIYSERTLEADKDNYMAMLLLASGLSQRTREHDLDKEEKLGRAEKYANAALALLKTAEKPNPQLPEEQWLAAKKDYEGQAHEALGIAAMARKKYDVAVQEFQAATAASTDPAVFVRLASAYNKSGKPDEAIAALDKLNAMPEVHPQIKQVAQNERNEAVKLKAAKK